MLSRMATWWGAGLLCLGRGICSPAAEPALPAIPAGLPALSVPADNPLSPDKIALGRQLYFDPRLSIDNTVSCASCHDPARGWSNGDRFATGIGGQRGGRSAPTIINATYQRWQFWDGRAEGLEGQALGPIQNPIEMNLSLDALVAKLQAIPGYRRQFEQLFGDVTPQAVAQALASFERTVLSGDAPYDRFVAGKKDALSPAAQRGYEVFFHRAHCSACHAGASFSDGAFHNLGVGIDDEKPDLGRETISHLEGDRGAFKTPTLREIARTAPYMHDGRLKTLVDVVEYYDKGGTPNPQLDEEIYPLSLTAAEKADLVVFLQEGLSSQQYPTATAGQLPQ